MNVFIGCAVGALVFLWGIGFSTIAKKRSHDLVALASRPNPVDALVLMELKSFLAERPGSCPQ